MAKTGQQKSTINSRADGLLRERLNDVTRMVSDWVWETDENLNLTYVSDRVFEVMEFHPYEIIGKKISDLIKPLKMQDEELSIIQRKPFREVMMSAETKSGKMRLFQVSSIPKYHSDSGKFSGVRGTAKDVTEEENTKRELIIALARAEEASSAKSDFLASMSHELRTPMNAILGFSQFILNNPLEQLPTTQQEYASDILKSGEHLMELINQVLDLSQIETGQHQSEFEAVNPHTIAEECQRMIMSRAKRLNIKIENMIAEYNQPMLWTDEQRFRQVFLNLLSNAVKYNRSGGTVTLTTRQTSPHLLRIIIRDTGVGIPREKQSDLFEPFNRLGREAGEIEGTGIGLTITKHVVEMLRGQMGFESEDGIGSTFWFELPIAKGDAGK